MLRKIGTLGLLLSASVIFFHPATANAQYGYDHGSYVYDRGYRDSRNYDRHRTKEEERREREWRKHQLREERRRERQNYRDNHYSPYRGNGQNYRYDTYYGGYPY